MVKAVIFDYGLVLRKILLQREMLKLAEELRHQGIKTAVLSNMVSPLAWVVNMLGDLRPFDPVVISSAVGLAKPNPEIYKIMINRLGLKPQECIFVDNRPGNLAPAQEFGMQIVLARKTRDTVSQIKKMVDESNHPAAVAQP